MLETYEPYGRHETLVRAKGRWLAPWCYVLAIGSYRSVSTVLLTSIMLNYAGNSCITGELLLNAYLPICSVYY